MPDQTRTIVGQAAGWRGLKGLLSLALVALTGCFGAEAMHYDVQEYNKQVVSSEKEMLLYNIGALHYGQPPHFMMLSSVSQSRTFTGSSGFNWANPATWSVPFTATGTENPTITFVPIQGQDFANRFETPLRDKFSYFLEDREWYATDAEKEAIVLLFAQSLSLSHGDNDKCKSGLYVNRNRDPQDLHPLDNHYYSELAACVNEIVESSQYVELIDGHHAVPTGTSEDPKATDVVTALGAGYEWNKSGGKFALTTPVKIPAWLDYDPDTNKAESPKPELPPIVLHPLKPPLTPTELVYGNPKGYTWTKDGKGDFVLVPDGYAPDPKKSGELLELGKCVVRPCQMDKSGVECDSKACRTGDCTAGNCEPEKCERDTCEHEKCYSGECDADKTRLSYSDKIVNYVWPAPQDYFYVELRQNDDPQHLPVYNKTAEDECFNDKKSGTPNNLICGYFKIGNFLQIMQRLARPDMVCTYQDQQHIDANCQQSIFGIADNLGRIPSWAENSAPYQSLIGRLTGPYVYVPAHNPAWDSDRAKRDSETFFDLYKLYQMSLVDTSKLVTGAPAITISK